MGGGVGGSEIHEEGDERMLTCRHRKGPQSRRSKAFVMKSYGEDCATQQHNMHFTTV